MLTSACLLLSHYSFGRLHGLVQWASCWAYSEQALRSVTSWQVWKRPGWPGSSLDGVFVQLESLRTKRTWFVPYKDGLLGCA